MIFKLMSRNDESLPPYALSAQRRLNLPLTLLVTIVAGCAVGYAAWVTVNDRVASQGRAIQLLEHDARTTREILIRIDENVKDLRRAERYPNRSLLSSP